MVGESILAGQYCCSYQMSEVFDELTEVFRKLSEVFQNLTEPKNELTERLA